MEWLDKKNIVLFDGVCNLCSKSVQFIIKHDKKKLFHFASLQSDIGQLVLQKFNLPVKHFNSFILYQNGKLYQRSTAALKVCRQLSGWKWTVVFFVVPQFIRDAVYNLVAKNRYKWFGQHSTCWIPTPELKERFLGA
jgi:predicted DCC family thiol-disulfide oxidoreductase YuxK